MSNLSEDEVEDSNLISLKYYCKSCKKEIPDGAMYYDHPKHGEVCEYCPEFSDGGICLVLDD